MNNKIKNALTIDVEDYFQVAALKDAFEPDQWDEQPSRVVANTERLLQIFERHEVKATFFVLGWVADRFPALVRDIVAQGHELACHGYSHQLIYDQDRAVFREETIRAKSVLEDISGVRVNGYRAASYSITARSTWAIDILVDAGFEYDSSIVPARHDLYGIVDAPQWPYEMRLLDGRTLKEFPPTTINLAGTRLPIGGGGYFRLFPYAFSRWGLKKVNEEYAKPFSFYLHPWELDPGQPRVKTSLKSRVRHYTNLDKCESRLDTLLEDFAFQTMSATLAELELKTLDAPAGEQLSASPAHS